MRRHRASLLILRRRPRPLKRPPDWMGNAIRDHWLGVYRRELDVLRRDQQMLRQGDWLAEVHRYRVNDLGERFRLQEAQIALNREQIGGLISREVPGWGAREKAMAFELVNRTAEEVWELRQRVDAVERAVGDTDER